MPTQTKESARRLLNFSDNYQYLLLSFGAYGLDSSKFNFENLDESTYLVVSGLEKSFGSSGINHKDKVFYLMKGKQNDRKEKNSGRTTKPEVWVEHRQARHQGLSSVASRPRSR
jgi:hypothetical protein